MCQRRFRLRSDAGPILLSYRDVEATRMSDNELFWPEWGNDPDPATRPTTPIAHYPEPSPPLPAQPGVRRRPAWLAPAAAAGAAALVLGGVGVGVGAALDHDDTSAAGGGFTIAGDPVSTSAAS